MPESYIIEAKGLTKKFESLTAVNKLDLKIKEGEIFGLLGPNGAGKTTTLSMLATLVKPTSGTAVVNGYDIVRQPGDVRKSIGMVFQDPSSDDVLSGRDNLYLHALLYGVDTRDIKKKIDAVLSLVDLKDRQNEIVKKYSGGMRRRLELARGLLHQPKILFLDEPTLGLDPQTRGHMWEYIRKLVKEKHVTIIITTHYMEEADLLCDRVAIVDHGRIAALDTPERLKRALGGDVVRLRMQKPNAGALGKLKHVRKVKIGKGEVFMTVDNASERLQDILKAVGKVDSVELRSPTLNDVFLHYTGKEIREEEGEGGYFERMINSRRSR
jgi:ABC-2 type transport system ATP-binding protein